MAVVHDLGYTLRDHQLRSRDEYARGKYDITTRWLAPMIRRGQTLLNIGCGGGEYNAIARQLGLRVIACEPEDQACEMAIAAARNDHDCVVHHCGMLELAERIEPADFIVMHDVLEHIEDDTVAVAAIAQLLKPDGIAVVSVPAYQWLFGHHDVQLGHYRRYTESSLCRVLESALEIEAARYYGAAFIPIALWFSKLRKRDYPIARASGGVVSTAVRVVCQLESRIGLPAGTSVVARVRRRTVAPGG
jgi:SAM-dependent methyltransferase